MCITTIQFQPDTKSNPNPNHDPNLTTKQHAIVNIRLNIDTMSCVSREIDTRHFVASSVRHLVVLSHCRYELDLSLSLSLSLSLCMCVCVSLRRQTLSVHARRLWQNLCTSRWVDASHAHAHQSAAVRMWRLPPEIPPLRPPVATQGTSTCDVSSVVSSAPRLESGKFVSRWKKNHPRFRRRINFGEYFTVSRHWTTHTVWLKFITATENQGQVEECSNVFGRTGTPHFRGTHTCVPEFFTRSKLPIS